MVLTVRENYIRNASFQFPEYTPMGIGISNASWDQWRDEMEDVVARHPVFWPDFIKGQRNWDTFDFGPAYTAGKLFTDAWSCTWECAVNGLEGVVSGHPLKTWDDLDTWQAPDPLVQADRGPADWEETKRAFERAAAEGRLLSGGVAHGFLFMRLTYLRGFENMMIDMALEEPRLFELIDRIYQHSKILCDRYMELGVDMLNFGEDLGLQHIPVISPEMFRKYIRPTYEKLMRPAREQGKHVYLHSDGYIMDLIDDMLESGVTILNPQDICNGIDNLRRELKGRACISLDVDRQSIVPFGTPQEIHELIEEEVRTLGSRRGGLAFVVGIYPPTPPENVHALASALEEYQTYWFDGRGRY